MKLKLPFCLAVITICFTLNSFSQNNNIVKVNELIKLKFPLAEIEWEKPVSNKTVIYLNGGIGGGLATGMNSSGNNYFKWMLAPYTTVGYRNYYNISKRYQQGKNIQNNAANFFAVDLKATFPAIATSKGVHKTEGLFLSLVPNWGMQRSLSRNFNFEWFVGAGAGLNLGQEQFKTIYFQPRLGFAFSYLLKK